MKRYVALVCIVLLAGCQSSRPDTVRLFAAMSTREAVEAVAADFTKETGIPVEVTPAASSTLARQIENGADAHLFLSADEQWADYLEKRGLVAERRDLLGNRLVIVIPTTRNEKLSDLAELKDARFRRLAVGRPEVPVGTYAREALTKAGVWDALEPRILEAGDVRAVLTYVERGEADAGIVYATDAKLSSRVHAAYIVLEKSHTPIRYPLVRVKRGNDNPSAVRFYEYLRGAAARKRFEDAGFIVLD